MADLDDDIKEPVDIAELLARLQRLEQRIVEMGVELETVRREIAANRKLLGDAEHP